MGRRPDLFIIGAAKCGTTSLYEYLKSHPQVFMSPTKEPRFFSPTARRATRSAWAKPRHATCSRTGPRT